MCRAARVAVTALHIRIHQPRHAGRRTQSGTGPAARPERPAAAACCADRDCREGAATPQQPRRRRDRRRMHRAGQLRSLRGHGQPLVTVRLGYFDAGPDPGSKMRIELAREHADHPLLRRVSAHLDTGVALLDMHETPSCTIDHIHAHILVHM
jgi:hypothetical protein